MGAFETYIHSGKYKLWKAVRVAIHPSLGPVYRPSEIKPVGGSRVKLVDTLDLYVVDDTPLGVGNFHWYFSLCDFEKLGRTRDKVTYRRQQSNSYSRNKFYDESLEDKLGGFEQTLG